jgi:glucose-1-phosphate cytidylyltransferase
MNDLSKITAVILAGGLGTRLREETEFRPKPMVEVGGKPILWHIMKNLSVQGISNFIICTGYKGFAIKEYFLNYDAQQSDLHITLGESPNTQYSGIRDMVDWKVSVVDTGLDTPTGGRLNAIKSLIKHETFLCTYGDGLADINLRELYKMHKKNATIATVTSVQPFSRFGVLEISESGIVNKFREKPRVDGWVNAGFFMLNTNFFSYLSKDSVLETEPLSNLVAQGQLTAYKHNGFWQPMDTYRESLMLNQMWNSGEAPWKNWN